jgi:hypothetical protein
VRAARASVGAAVDTGRVRAAVHRTLAARCAIGSTVGRTLARGAVGAAVDPGRVRATVGWTLTGTAVQRAVGSAAIGGSLAGSGRTAGLHVVVFERHGCSILVGLLHVLRRSCPSHDGFTRAEPQPDRTGGGEDWAAWRRRS